MDSVTDFAHLVCLDDPTRYLCGTRCEDTQAAPPGAERCVVCTDLVRPFLALPVFERAVEECFQV